ncbi:hypothetical protein OVY29_04895 [Sphingopyxis sp. SE2]|uniref:hypothetical protein n=1 Tax=Sphingopyxis sp. SE2 TaxID=1586240 RepID=UPI0028C23B91|nr:hypothetical protein [Sphingopyxis sp. SE2]MDT7527995.1 hypothetical protein [Sphingopyxis sp. SE2]
MTADGEPVLQALMDHINREPTESEYAAIGRVALNHTALEYQIESLIWTYMKDVDLGHIATSGQSTDKQIQILKTLVEWNEPEDHVADAIDWSISAFKVLRTNRNNLVHGFNFTADRKGGGLHIERRRKPLIFDSHEIVVLSNGILDGVVNDQRRLAIYLWRISMLISRRGDEHIGHDCAAPDDPTDLPSRPVMPTLLQALPHEPPRSPHRSKG